MAVADMAMKIEAARLLTYRACAIIDAGDPDRELNAVGAMAKTFASDVASGGDHQRRPASRWLRPYTSDFPTMSGSCGTQDHPDPG